MRNLAQAAAYLLGIAMVLWLLAASAAWAWRNPLGNRTTFWRNFPDAMTFKKLPQYQERTP